MAEAKAEIVANVWKVVVSVGDVVTEGEPVAILETMKMEIPVPSPAAGTVTEIPVTEGQIVQEGDVIAVIG